MNKYSKAIAALFTAILAIAGRRLGLDSVAYSDLVSVLGVIAVFLVVNVPAAEA